MSLESIWRAFNRVKYRKMGKKYHPVFQKKALNNIFIIKSQNLKTRGIKIKGVLIKMMNQNFSKSKILRKWSNLEHFQWRGRGGGSVKILVYKFWTSQKFIFPTIIIFLV